MAEISKSTETLIRLFAKVYRLVMFRLTGRWVSVMGGKEEATDVASSKNFPTLMKIVKNLWVCGCFDESGIYDFVISQVDDLDRRGNLPYQYIGKFAHEQAVTNYRSFLLLEKPGRLDKGEVLFQLSPEFKVRQYLESDLSYIRGEVNRRRDADVKGVVVSMLLDGMAMPYISKISPMYVAGCPELFNEKILYTNIDRDKLMDLIKYLKKTPGAEDPSHQIFRSDDYNVVEKGFMFFNWDGYIINRNLIHKMRNGLKQSDLSKVEVDGVVVDLWV